MPQVGDKYGMISGVKFMDNGFMLDNIFWVTKSFKGGKETVREENQSFPGKAVSIKPQTPIGNHFHRFCLKHSQQKAKECLSEPKEETVTRKLSEQSRLQQTKQNTVLLFGAEVLGKWIRISQHVSVSRNTAP